MATTYVILRTASGAETSSARADGTAVAKAGKSGWVKAACFATVKTATFLVKGRQSGREVVPNGSAPQGLIGASNYTQGKIQANDFIFAKKLLPDEEIEVTIVAAAAQDGWVALQVDD